jgi:glyoxylase-like metal-dependent hydrolase (beta-lactamase superfamily II)
MFGVVPKTIWSRMAPPDDHNRIALQTNCLLLEGGAGRRVVIETGFGGKWPDKERGFYDLERRTIEDALAEADVDPAGIDLVVVTHLHFDHAAGLTRLDGDRLVATFPNAEILVQRQEWEDARANRSTMTKTYLASHLEPIADRVRLADGAEEVAPGLLVWPMPGHTWGQQAVRFDDGAGVVCFPADVMPTVNHVHASFSMGYDMMPHENMRSKLALLQRAAAGNWRLVLDHEPGNPVVRVEADVAQSGRYRLMPAE